MAFTASTMRTCKMLIATAFAVAALSTAAQAYSAEQEQMCAGDAMRLCSAEIPDVERVTACMVQKRAQLSDGCKAVFHYVPPATATPVSYAPTARPSKLLNLTPNKRG
ncbi:MAG: hypothetical protein PS018_22550 [bacterium]|nr:hypothetical protein [bacterium]